MGLDVIWPELKMSLGLEMGLDVLVMWPELKLKFRGEDGTGCNVA
jgi:hypothetical protein